MFILTGAWGAIKHHFPTADIKGCVFHWSQAVLRKVAKLGLKTAYDQKQSTHIFIRKILALPFLPSDHIRPAFLQLVQTSTTGTQQLQQLMTYLSRTWFTNTVWNVRQSGPCINRLYTQIMTSRVGVNFFELFHTDN